MTESSEGNEVSATLTSVTTARNRLMSWDSTVQELTKPGDVTPSSKNSITPKPVGFIGKKTKLFFATVAKLPYKLFKFSYEIAKLFTRGLAGIRRLLSGSKKAR